MTADDTELQEINIFNDEQRRISQEHTLAEHYHDHPKSQEERKKFSVEKSSVLPYYEKKEVQYFKQIALITCEKLQIFRTLDFLS